MKLEHELARHALSADASEQAGFALLTAAVGVLEQFMGEDVVARLLRDMAATIERRKISVVE